MKVALLNHDYPPYIFGGIGNFVHELAKGLTRQGVEVSVITGYPNTLQSWKKLPYKSIEDGIEVYRFPFPPIQPRHTMFQLFNQKQILKTITELDVNVIHGQCGATYPLIANLKKIAPVLVTFHGSPLYEKKFSTQSIVRGGSLKDFSTFLLGYPAWHFTYKKELRGANAATAVSESLKSELLEEMGENYSSKICPVHNGVDIPSLDKAIDENGHIPESERRILFAGRLFWRKGALNVIRFAYLLQQKEADFKIIVHGTGPLFKKMQELIVSLQLKNIELKGFTKKSELIRSLKSSKFVLIPSTYEACPMILLEAMCLGKIPLMLKLPFSSELTKDGQYAILGSDLNELAEKILLAKNEQSIHRLSEEIRTFGRDAYNMDKVASKYISAYQNLT